MVGNIKTSYITVDTSFILAKLLMEENSPSEVDVYFSKFKEVEIDFIAPFLLKIEVANGLRSAYLRKRITQNLAKKVYRKFLEMPIKYIRIDYNKMLNTAITKNLSAYDACFVFLADSKKTNLLSLDKQLIEKI